MIRSPKCSKQVYDRCGTRPPAACSAASPSFADPDPDVDSSNRACLSSSLPSDAPKASPSSSNKLSRSDASNAATTALNVSSHGLADSSRPLLLRVHVISAASAPPREGATPAHSASTALMMPACWMHCALVPAVSKYTPSLCCSHESVWLKAERADRALLLLDHTGGSIEGPRLSCSNAAGAARARSTPIVAAKPTNIMVADVVIFFSKSKCLLRRGESTQMEEKSEKRL